MLQTKEHQTVVCSYPPVDREREYCDGPRNDRDETSRPVEMSEQTWST